MSDREDKMRIIKIPAWAIEKARTVNAASALLPVKVDWPELQLTEAQVWANVVAVVAGQPTPYPDLSIITIEIERSKS